VHILLVNMPWAPIDLPSLALGILRQATRAAVAGSDVEVMHANLDYVDWIAERREFDLGDYYYYSQDTYFSGVGDWVFSSALYDDAQWRVPELIGAVDIAPERQDGLLALHRSAPDFVAEITSRILAFGPDLVGFTSTFQQNVAALAAARAIKQAAPAVLTAFGGANCDGVQGEAVHRNFGFVDFVIRGEGEAAFPGLLTAIQDGTDGGLAAVPGLSWRDPAGRSVHNPMNSRPLRPAEIVAPDYDGYFERLAASTAREWVEPKLVVEGSRGCWWGEKHHCTFCGLNGSFMEFRSKSPAAFRDEILRLVRRHQVLDMFVVDNILDLGYVTGFLPAIREAGYDLRMQYEIKSNMRRHQLDAMYDAGLVTVQPGIESLSSRVLKIMDKGVTGCQNVRTLRDAASAGLSVLWNYLYGFPGESEMDYLPILAQFPALHHLPPMDSSLRIAIERFSPYFNRPELGFTGLRPAAQYGITYDLPEAELRDLAYLFDAPARGIPESLGAQVQAAAAQWQREYAGSRLSCTELDGEILLVSRRSGFDWTVLRLTDPTQVAAFRLLEQPHTAAALAGKLAAQPPTRPPAEPAAQPATEAVAVAALLAEWVALGIVFTDAGQYVHVAVAPDNSELLRISPRQPQPALAAAVGGRP
jgi:ribosomal peptide maturation radical SAM protein 1